MGVYHVMAIFFPIALLNIAFLFILIRTFSSGSLATRLETAIAPLIYLGVLAGVAGYVLGLLSWPYSALTASPLGRNHLLMASWTIAYWLVLSILVWRVGPALWSGAVRWVMLILSAFGVGLLTITGSLGGSVAGNPSGVSDLVRQFGWEVYTTFYAPDLILWLVILVSAILVSIGVWGRRRHA